MEDRIEQLTVKLAEVMFETFLTFFLANTSEDEKYSEMILVTLHSHMISLFNAIKMLAVATGEDELIDNIESFTQAIHENMIELFKFQPWFRHKLN